MFFESSSDGFIFVHKKTESTFSGCLKNSYKTKKVITHLLLTLRKQDKINKRVLTKEKESAILYLEFLIALSFYEC